MKKLSQIKMESIVDSHRKKLVNGAKIILFASMVLQMFCLYGIYNNPMNIDPYAIAFVFVSLTGLFGLLQYSQHRRDFR